MDNIHQAISQFAIAMGYIQYAHMSEKCQESFVIDEGTLEKAKVDFAESFAVLNDNLQKSAIVGIMEGIEGVSWFVSPEEDYEKHSSDLQDLFISIVTEMAEMEDNGDSESEEEKADGGVYEFTGDKQHLEDCLKAS